MCVAVCVDLRIPHNALLVVSRHHPERPIHEPLGMDAIAGYGSSSDDDQDNANKPQAAPVAHHGASCAPQSNPAKPRAPATAAGTSRLPAPNFGVIGGLPPPDFDADAGRMHLDAMAPG
eukprot:365408-Chlamydomonas_euryale.AAC.22